MKRKMIPEALKAAEKAVRLSPNGATFLNNLTLLYFANKDYVNAEIMARRTIKAQDNILSCYTILFDILITQKRYLEAAELVPRLVKMGVKIPAAAMQLYNRIYNLIRPYLILNTMTIFPTLNEQMDILRTGVAEIFQKMKLLKKLNDPLLQKNL